VWRGNGREGRWCYSAFTISYQVTSGGRKLQERERSFVLFPYLVSYSRIDTGTALYRTRVVIIEENSFTVKKREGTFLPPSSYLSHGSFASLLPFGSTFGRLCSAVGRHHRLVGFANEMVGDDRGGSCVAFTHLLTWRGAIRVCFRVTTCSARTSPQVEGPFFVCTGSRMCRIASFLLRPFL
jgi:hypothetical protein